MAYVPAVFYVTITALWRVGAGRVQSNTSNSHPLGSSRTTFFTFLTIDSWAENSYCGLRGYYKKKKEGGGRGWNMKRKSALKNKWSRSKCQGVLREAVPVCPQAFRSKVQ